MGRRDEYRERRLRLNARIREHNAAIVNLIRRSVRVIPELVRSWADQERSKNVAWSLAKRNVKWAKARRAAQARANAEQPRHMSFTKASDDPEVHAKDATRAASDLKLEEKKPKVEEKNLQQQKPAFSFAKGAKKATKTQSDAQQKSQQQHSDFSFEKGTAKAKKRAAEKKHQEAIKKIVTDRSTSLAEKNASLKAEDKRRFDEITSQRIVPHLAPDLIASQQQQQIPEPEPVYERPAMLDALQEPSDPVAPQQQAPEIKAQQEPIYESLDSLIGNLGQARISAFSEPPTLAASANPSRGPKPDPPDYDERDNSPRARLAWADYRKQLDAWERGETTNTTNFQDRQQRGPHL